MGRSKLFKEKLLPGRIYHVYNQTNNKELLFKTIADRQKFLANLEKFISPFAHIFAYNLMSNHFHLLIEVFEKEKFLSNISKHFIHSLPPACLHLVLMEDDNMDEIMSNRFASMFKGYSGYFNNRKNRVGNFFHRPFCRKFVDTDKYFKQAAFYIHANSVRHGVTEKILEYDWTSFHNVVEQDNSLLNLTLMFDYFGGEEAFNRFHLRKHKFEDEDKFVIEEADLFKTLRDEEE